MLKTVGKFFRYWCANFTDAKERGEVVSGVLAGVFAVFIAVISWAGVASPGFVQKIVNWDATPWIGGISTAISAFLLLLWIPFSRHRNDTENLQKKINELEGYLNPKEELIIQCAPEIKDSISDPHQKMAYNIRGIRHLDYGRWFRVVMHANRPAPVEDCWGCVTKVLGPGIEQTFDGAELTWAPGTPQNPRKTISRTPTEKLDVLRVSEYGIVVFGTPALGWNYQPANEIFSQPGDYAITVVVNGRGVNPYTLTLTFHWTGGRDSSLRLTKIDR